MLPFKTSLIRLLLEKISERNPQMGQARILPGVDWQYSAEQLASFPRNSKLLASTQVQTKIRSSIALRLGAFDENS